MNGIIAPQVAAIMEAEAERLRLQSCADQHRADNLPRPEYLTIRDEMIDGQYEVMELDNEEIIEIGREYGMELPELVARLELFLVWAREQKCSPP